ncbi:MAG: TIR domain-containing protein [Planctomycetes bacterium]|nr:TIR domain-containing protein [Planctomycetota bacterium]
MDIREWLAELGLPQYAEAFAANHLSDTADAPFRDLTHDLLKEIGVASVGHRMTILRAKDALGPGAASSTRATVATTVSLTAGTPATAAMGTSSPAVGPESGAASPSAADRPIRVFLSYGHDEHEPVASRIKRDLERRGHKVWFDVERLRLGQDFPAYIEEGLRSCDKMLLLMTPHSVRRRDPRDPSSTDGFCLNEIAKALERNMLIIPVLVAGLANGPPISICRIQYLDLRDCLPPEEKAEKYASRFKRLLDALECDKLDFEGGQARLKRALRPLDFDADIARHVAAFTGRHWLRAEVDRWLAGEVGATSAAAAPVAQAAPGAPPVAGPTDASRIFWLVGGPGVGKSAFAAHLAHYHGRVAAHHLCVHGHDEKADPRKALLSLAYQMAQHLPEYDRRLQALDVEAQAAANAYTVFDTLWVQPLGKDFPAPDTPRLVILDGLDESTRNGRNELAEVVRDCWPRTPLWLRLLVTSRPESGVMSTLAGLAPYVFEAERAENLQDIRDYLWSELTARGFAPRGVAVDEVVRRSEGVFLYAKVVLEELVVGRLSLDRPEEFPVGLAGYYQKFFQRQFPEVQEYGRGTRSLVGAICAQRGPLPLGIAAAAAGLSDFELREQLGELGSLFPIRRAATGTTAKEEAETVAPFHQSVSDWLTTKDRRTGLHLAGPYAVDAADGERRLAEEGMREHGRGAERMSAYMIAHLPAHLARAGREDDLEAVLTDLVYLEVKAAAGRALELVGDFTEAKRVLEADRPGRERVRLLGKAISRDAAFVALHPTALFQCLWNSCWWHDCAEAAEHYDPPEGGWGPGGAPWEREGPKLSALLEAWRAAKERRTPDFPWLRSIRPPATAVDSPLELILSGHEYSVTSVAFSPDGGRIASGSNDETLRVWDAATGREIACLRGHESSVESVAFSPDGGRLASGSCDRTVRVWEAETGRQVTCLRGHQLSVKSVAFSPDGRRIASASRDKTVRVWDAATGREIACLRGHASSVESVAFSPDGGRLASGSCDRTVRVWEAETGRQVACIRPHQDFVEGDAYSPDGGWKWSGAYDQDMREREVRTGREIPFHRHTSMFTSVAYSPDGGRIASASYDHTVRVWEAETGEEVACLRGHESSVESVAYSPDGGRIASGSWDKTVRVWDATTGRELACVRTFNDWVCGVTFSPDGGRVASGSREKTVRIWDVSTGQEIACLRGHEKEVTSVAFSLDSGRIASGSLEKTVRIWDAATGREIACLRGHEGSVESVAFSPDGGRIASGSCDNTVRVWELETGREVACLRGHGDQVNSIAFSPNGGRIASGANDGTVRVWEADTGREIACLPGHEQVVWSVAFSPDGVRIASGSWDKTVRVWEATTGREIACLRGHGRSVTSLAYSPDGGRIAGLSGDTVVVWDTGTGECLQVIDGSSDALSVAYGHRQVPWRSAGALVGFALARADTREAVAWFPQFLWPLAFRPSLSVRRWAGAAGSELVILALEGGHDLERRIRQAPTQTGDPQGPRP